MSERQSRAPSRRLLGRYEIVAEIARGGMGTVFLARLEGVGGFRRLVAVKLMHRHLATEAQFASMLLDEARLASQLHHPNAVGVIDVDRAPVGLYIVMEYVDGFALDDVLEKLEAYGAETRIRIGLRVWLDAVRGLAAAHRLKNDDGEPLNIVHRDVSPQNILVGLDGAGRITDFGVARAAERITSSHPGMIKGKPCYMAPEQAQGAAELDKRADIFALGVVLWEVLAGRMLFRTEGGPAATLLRVVNDPILAPSTESPEAAPLDAACGKALERTLDARFASGRAMFEEVEGAARAAGLVATQEEVADFMHEAFAEEIATRKRAIKEHLSAIGEASTRPMQESDIYAVPLLKEPTADESRTSAERPAQKAGESGPWHETPHSQSALSATPDAPTLLAPSTSEPAPSRRASPAYWRRVAFGLALVGIAMSSVAGYMLYHQSEGAAGAEAGSGASAAARLEAELAEAREAARTVQELQAAAERAATEAAAMNEEIAARAAEAASEETAARAAEAASEDAADEAEPAAHQDTTSAEQSAASARRRRRAERRAEARGMEASMASSAEPAAASAEPATMDSNGTEPAFETNPYV
ncbi:MAG: serine/threonine-protein kinase, partial [Myxococcota bacterium]